jgi:hypothetical protein
MSRRGAPKNGDQVGIVNTRIKRPCTTKMQRLVKRRREPHEIPSRRFAIYNQCLECSGFDGDHGLAAEVDACPGTDCPLWPVRCRNALNNPYIDHSNVPLPNLYPSYPNTSKRTESRQKPQNKNLRRQSFGRRRMITDFCAECQGLIPRQSRNPIRECLSPKCWLYPWRTGKLDVDTYEPETLEDLERRVEAECRERGKTG